MCKRTQSDLENVKSEIEEKFGVTVSITATDLSVGDNVRKLLDANSNIDILVNNAGAIPAGSIDQNTEDIWRNAWDLKVFGYINACRAAYANMKVHVPT